MIRVLVHGSNGKMGAEVLKCLSKDADATLLCGVDRVGTGAETYPYYKSFAEVQDVPDVIIDFSYHALIGEVLDYAERVGRPAVIATTGFTESELARLREAAKKIPVFFSGNMSVGIALLVDFAKKAAAAFPDADIEIVETHHNRKQDAPSGTALMIADGIREVRRGAKYNLARHGEGKREKDEIGIHALRMANIVGEHEVFITTDTQQLCIKHTAYDRALFAEGAVKAATFLVKKESGLYNMYDMLYD
jgi:4-hydroxy-tetrahydrodipicolinate reductase